ncbi:FG-GAP repeat domain-containing protein [Sorangium sp. So ce131]|uniref:FG-GAP repeat domain-containing protein n=1 Tax=Sorangium sp. So ce131 TaxID=3133282 RepID=UPI003F62D20A
MKRSAAVRAALRAALGIHTMAACASGSEPLHEDRSVEPTASSLAAATPRSRGYTWEAVRLNDFNFDGMGDILWNNTEQSLMAIWLMEGDRVLSPGPFIPGPVGEGWAAANAGDFNFDSMADVLWWNEEQNLIAIWLMDGDRLLVPGPVIPGPLGQGWEVHSVTDFNLDGMTDVLWNDPEENLITVWLMDGDRLLVPGPVIPGPAGEGWVAPTAQDANFDNMGDVFWNNPEQNLMAVWLMEGTQLLVPGPVIPGPLGSGWRIVTSEDTSFDSMGDVLWNNPEQNLLAVWLMEGTHLLAPGPAIPGPLGSGWAVRPGTDVNFDGMGDVLWYAAGTDQAAVWLMDGTQLLAPGPVILGPLDGL